MKSEAAVVTLAKKRGTPAWRTVHSMRSASPAGLPRARSMRDWPHVSCSTKMLSADTPTTTASDAAAKAESVPWKSTTHTQKYMRGKESTICAAARHASRHCPK